MIFDLTEKSLHPSIPKPRLPIVNHMWEAITESILPDILNESELAVITGKRTQQSQDPVPGILSGVVAEFRARMASGGRTRLQGEDNYLPQELYGHACALIRYRLLTRFALSVSDARQAEWEEANRVLRDLSSGAYVIAGQPDAAPTPSPRYSGRPARWGMSRRGGVM